MARPGARTTIGGVRATGKRGAAMLAFGLTVAGGVVYAAPSAGTRGDVALPVVTDTYAPAGSYAVGIDARTGAPRWTSERLDDGNAASGTFINATPVA